jgi:hypothetical protein
MSKQSGEGRCWNINKVDGREDDDTKMLIFYVEFDATMDPSEPNMRHCGMASWGDLY